jgi:hypothetical protein
MASRSGSSFGGSSFGNLSNKQVVPPAGVKPITTEFSRGSIQGSISTINRESAWNRWRKGYELATASTHNTDYQYDFSYAIPATTTSGNPLPVISGAFVGFPTANKEFGMHWAIWRYAGSLRCDQLTDPVTTDKLYIASVTEDSISWYVQLAGSWSSGNPLPAPFYIPVTGQPNGLRPATTEIFEDRIITIGGDIITKETIDPATQKRYGYVQAVATNIDPFTGIITFKKAGSVYVTPDAVYVTPSPVSFTVGRYLITGARYCCTCQDFTHRDYSFMRPGSSSNSQIPRNRIASIKPGRFELTKRDGILDNSAMTSANVNRDIEVYAPENFELDYTASNDSPTDKKATRDNPGVYREFGYLYTRGTSNIALEGSSAEGLPGYEDYSATKTTVDSSSVPQDTITSITDNWTPLLDELRYCKHIYALKFKDRVFPPEPSDFPVGPESMVNWEQKLVAKTEREQQQAGAYTKTRYSLAMMDVPPYNSQSPMIYPILQKLFNITTDRILISNFTMYDKDGKPYAP